MFDVCMTFFTTLLVAARWLLDLYDVYTSLKPLKNLLSFFDVCMTLFSTLMLRTFDVSTTLVRRLLKRFPSFILCQSQRWCFRERCSDEVLEQNLKIFFTTPLPNMNFSRKLCQDSICGQFNKCSMIVNYNSRVVMISKLQSVQH